MSGILEGMKAQMDQNTAAIAQLTAAVAALSAGGAPAAAPVAADPFASFGGGTPTPAATPTPVNVTSDMLLSMIQPYIDNDAHKAALGAEMRAMGINALPETQPHQYAELYARFKACIDRGFAPATAQVASASII